MLYKCKKCNINFIRPKWRNSIFCSISCLNNRLKEEHPQWKGGQIKKQCLICDNNFYVYLYRKNSSKYCSKTCSGKAKVDKPSWNKGITGVHFSLKTEFKKGVKRGPMPEEIKLKISNAQKGIKSHKWKGGISRVHKTGYRSMQYKQWRKSVFERDNYTCKMCGNFGCKLNADHIKPFAYFPNLRFDINNGRTLCVQCHRKTDTYGIKATRLYEKAIIS